MTNLWLKPAEIIKIAILNSSSWLKSVVDNFTLLAITENSHVKNHVGAKTTVTGQT